MNKIIATITVVIAMTISCRAQIVINEILFNIPGAGEDQEFIEIHNTGASPVNMLNYTVVESGLAYTFGNTSIAAGGYFVIAKDSTLFLASFGFSPDAESFFSLSNAGEDIMIYDNNGILVDSVDYETSAPWPGNATQGRSYQLCDPLTDNNDGANWGDSNIATGVNTQTGTDSLYATPGQMNVCGAACSPTAGTETVVTCDTYTWSLNSTTYTNSTNSPTVTLTNAAGCDSVVTLDLTILTSSTGTDVQSACGSYTWIDGNTYTTSNNTATHILSNAEGCDSLVTLDLTILSPSSGTDVQIACISYTWIDGVTYTSSNNTATHTLSNAVGCDSTITLNLTINSVDTGITQSGFTLSSNTSSATYQWLDCDNGFAPVVGATNQSFSASSNGNYALAVTENGCSDTSSCYSINGIGVNEVQTVQALVHPNPSTGAFTLELNQTSKSLNMSIYSSTGQLIFRRKLENELVINFNLEQAPGLYLLVLEDKAGIKSSIRLIKE